MGSIELSVRRIGCVVGTHRLDLCRPLIKPISSADAVVKCGELAPSAS